MSAAVFPVLQAPLAALSLFGGCLTKPDHPEHRRETAKKGEDPQPSIWREGKERPLQIRQQGYLVELSWHDQVEQVLPGQRYASKDCPTSHRHGHAKQPGGRIVGRNQANLWRFGVSHRSAMQISKFPTATSCTHAV